MKKLAYAIAVMATSGAIVLALTQCSSNDSNNGGDAAANCPANPPNPGTACFLPNGTVCNQYPQPGCACCGSFEYVCQDGKWQETGGAPGSGGAVETCPTSLPEAGVSCFLGCAGSGACSYDCTTGNGTAATATCVSGQWNVTPLKVACAVDGGSDAGNDAGSDAGDGG